jgi:hypothetical protein
VITRELTSMFTNVKAKTEYVAVLNIEISSSQVSMMHV